MAGNAQNPPTVVKVYDFDPNRPLAVGRNPWLISTSSIPYTPRIPRREKAARELVQGLTGRQATISHGTDGNTVIATVFVPSTNIPGP